jgi:RHS repeat-associated protein
VSGYTYDVYGEPTVTGGLANEFDFAGQQTDGSTGLQYLRARYYDPETGTFLSRDPLANGVDWIERPYGYGGSNVTNLTDPTGLWSCGWLAKVCGGIRGASSWVGSQTWKWTKRTYEWVKDVGWNTARATANAGLTAFALSLVPLDRLGSCRVRSDGIIGCFGLGDLLGDIDASAITIGNVILTREYSWRDLGADTIAHEIAHADQWAVAGLSTWPAPWVGQAAMAGSYAAAQALFGTCGNPFEQEAGVGPGTGVRERTCGPR